jgi:hypothetical protein
VLTALASPGPRSRLALVDGAPGDAHAAQDGHASGVTAESTAARSSVVQRVRDLGHDHQRVVADHVVKHSADLASSRPNVFGGRMENPASPAAGGSRRAMFIGLLNRLRSVVAGCGARLSARRPHRDLGNDNRIQHRDCAFAQPPRKSAI